MANIEKGSAFIIKVGDKVIGKAENLSYNTEIKSIGKVAPKGFGQPWIDFQDLIWQSDWNGDEVGFEEVPVVGLYTWRDTGVNVYLNTETMEILDIWQDQDE